MFLLTNGRLRKDILLNSNQSAHSEHLKMTIYVSLFVNITPETFLQFKIFF